MGSREVPILKPATGKKFREGFFRILLSFFVAMGAAVFLSLREIPEVFFHSDMLYLPVLYQDWILDGGSITGWSFTPAPYFFPDLPVYFTLAFLVGPGALSLRLFGLVQVAGFLLAGIFFQRSLPRDRRPPDWMPGVVAGLSMIFALSVKPLVIFLLPSAHFSSFLATLILGGIIIRQFTRESSGSSRKKDSVLIPGVLLLILMFVSDRLILLHFVLPATLVIAGVFWKNQEPGIGIRIKRILFAGITGVLAGWILSRILHTFLHLEKPARIPVVKSLAFFLRDLSGEFAGNGVALFFLFLYFLSLLIVFLALRKTAGRTGSRAAFLFLLAFQILTALVPPLTGFYTDLYSTRYNIFVFPVALWVVLSVGLGIQRGEKCQERKWTHIFSMGFFSLLTLVFLSTLYGELKEGTWQSWIEYQPEVVGCLDRLEPAERGMYGLADYWNAKRVSIFSRENLRAYHVGYGNLKGSYTLANRNWFRCSPGEPGCPEFHFVLVENLGEKRVRSAYGNPDRVVQCGDSKIYLYRESGRLKAAVQR